MSRGRASTYGDGVGRRELLLVFLVGCNGDFADDAEEGRYAAADAPDAKIDRGFPEPVPDAEVEASLDAGADTAVDAAKADAGICMRDESRDESQCAPADAGRYAVACPADEAGNPAAPPPATLDCVYTGWADAGTLTMCCK